jgi:hypothetical protein
MVAPDQNHFEPPGGVAGELWPSVVAYAFAFRIMTFVSDNIPLGRSEGHLKIPIQSATRQEELILFAFRHILNFSRRFI